MTTPGTGEPTPPVATPPVEPAEPAPPKSTATPPAAPSDETPEQKIERLEAAVKAANAEAAKARTTAKQNAADEARKELAQTIGKALGLVGDEPIDPAKLTEQVSTSTAEARQAKTELAVFHAAAAAGADASALLDSRTFMAALAEVDPADAAAVSAAVAEAVKANPAFANAGTRLPAPNPAQGGSASGPVMPAQLSDADVERLYAEKKYDEIEQARKEGRLNKILGVP